MTVRDLPAGYFALVMATGICSIALLDVGWDAASFALLVIAAAGFAVLVIALGRRIVRYPALILADLGAPDRAFGFFTVPAACGVLAARLGGDRPRGIAVALAALGAATWLGLTYLIPLRLIRADRPEPPLAGVDGTWFLWVVGTQSVAVSAAVLGGQAGHLEPAGALIAVLLWSVSVVLYLMIATLLLTRLLLVHVAPAGLGSPYWVTMGATAISVLAGAQILEMPGSPALTAAAPAVRGVALVLWGFGTWLIPLLAVFALWRHGLRRIRLSYDPARWSMVFPLGMYAVASMHLGAAAHLPIVAAVGRAWTALAIGVWLFVFAAMCRSLLHAAPVIRRAAERGGQ